MVALFPYVALGGISGPDISELIGGSPFFGGSLASGYLECLAPAPVGGQGQMFSPGNSWGLQLPTLWRKCSEKSMDAKPAACCPGDRRLVSETVVRGFIFKANARLLPEDHGILHSSLPRIDSPRAACDLWRDEDVGPRESVCEPCPWSVSLCPAVK